jgi:succinyl-CoA synthetase beta subunit
MNIFEFQAKELLRKAGIKVPEGHIAKTPDKAMGQAKKLLSSGVVVKAQLCAGGRGKAGGVKIAQTVEEVGLIASNLLGKKLVTPQSPEGQTVHTVLVEEKYDIAAEYYVSVIFDRRNARILMMASSEGGMDIETVAATDSSKIIKVHVDPTFGYTPMIGRRLAYGIGLTGAMVGKAMEVFEGLYRVYTKNDCSTVEVNPLVWTASDEFVALDAKIVFDDNAIGRHPHLEEFLADTEKDEAEVRALEYGFSYTKMSGDIGCLVNGAGLAMATMDIIKMHGGSPANFLDIGGSANELTIKAALEIIIADSRVTAILVNIFGGIVKCDLVANGIVAAFKSMNIKVPFIVRLEGTNVALGRKIIKESGTPITLASDFDDAAKKAMAAAKSGRHNS